MVLSIGKLTASGNTQLTEVLGAFIVLLIS